MECASLVIDELRRLAPRAVQDRRVGLRWVWRTLLFCAGAMAVACSGSRPSNIGDPPWTTYAENVQPILSSRCASCHSGSMPAGDYRVDSYLAAVDRRNDGTPRADPANADCLFLRAGRGQFAPHSALSDSEVSVLQDWVMRSRLAPRLYRVHDKGWMNPGDAQEFHGLYLRNKVYDFKQCTSCHGDDLRGGAVRVDCNTCHSGGVTACNTCHGDSVSPAPPRDLDGIRSTSSLGVGAHQAHVTDGSLHRGYSCDWCHFNPTTAEQEGHYQVNGQLKSRPVEVILRSTPSATAAWNRDSTTCTNAYCHQPNASDARAQNPTPHWTAVGTEEAACGSCHGLPPSSHTWIPPTSCPSCANFPCESCHRPSYSQPGTLALDRHANGVLDLGFQPGQCFGCHGDASSPAPPPDLLGQTSGAFPSVGAHRVHLEPAQPLRGPIDCSECHLVPMDPMDLFSAGHIDRGPPAIVFPPNPGVGTLARSNGANPTYDNSTAKCGSVYCHGGGDRQLQDTATLIRTPRWTGGVSQAICGACHGIPPTNGIHPPVSSDLGQCFNCHPTTVRADGTIIVTVDPITGQRTSTHINGRVECTTCP